MRRLLALAMAATLLGAVEANADSVSLIWLSSGTSLSTVAPGGSDTLQLIVNHNSVPLISDTIMVGIADVSLGAPKITAANNTPPVGAGSVAFAITPPSPNGTTVGAFGGLALGQINPGVYTVGTITIVAGGVGSFQINPFQRVGIDDWIDLGSNFIVPTLNGATLNVIPEPGTAALVGFGLVGLVMAGRRSRS